MNDQVRSAAHDAVRGDFFDAHPDPMWIYDIGTLRFLDVNDAAIETYGYSRDEFLAMTIAAIRPEEDVARLMTALPGGTPGLGRSGIWRHRLKSGRIIHVDITSHTIHFGNRDARLVAARDVTRLIELEDERAALLEREQELRRRSEAVATQFRSLFEAVPGKFLVLTPTDFEIVAASDAFLAATSTGREAITGRPLFEVFPEDPNAPHPSGLPALRRSLERVVASGLPDVMSVQRYALPRPGGDGYDIRYWSPVNTPVKSPDGTVAYIIHRTEDVTEFVRSAADATAGAAPVLDPRIAALGQDMLLRSAELQAANARLQEQDANLRMAKRLLGLGLWKQDLSTGVQHWSDEVHAIYGTDPRRYGYSWNAYLDLVHPEDRAATLARFNAFDRTREQVLEFQHRIVRPADGRTIHVRGIGELTLATEGRMLTGVVQDVTRQVEADARLREADNLLRIAGRAARLGGWRIDLDAEAISWTAETAAIHEVPEGFAPTFEEAVNFYVGEHRRRIVAAFAVCIAEGKPFDEILQITTAKGNPAWIRAIGEAEFRADGTVRAVRGAFQDVSELVAARARSEGLAERLRDTLDHISDAFFTLDAEWRFGFVNAQAETVLGRNRDEMIGHNVWEAFPEAKNTAFQREYERAVAEQRTVRFVEYFPPLGAWFQVNAYPSPDGLAVYFRDVTSERARQDHLRLLEAAVARQNDILIITEINPPDGKGPAIVFVNEAFVQQTGYSREEAIGRNPYILRSPNSDPQALARIDAAVASNQPVRAELMNRTKDGRDFWVDLDIVPLLNAEGRATHWVSLRRDITERKRAEEALRVSEERFRLVSRATHDVIWDLDVATDHLAFNENRDLVFGQAVTGTDGAENPEAVWLRALHPEDRERVLESFEAALAQGQDTWSADYRIIRPDGRIAFIADRGFIIRDASGQAVRVLGSMVDVTERRELDDRLRQSQKLEAVGQLTGGVAHDFNNLLTVILGNAEMLTEELSQNQQLRLMAEMTATAAQRGAELTNRLLAFARRQALEPKFVDVNRLVTGMEALLRRTLPANIDIEIVRSGGLWIAEIDPGQLEVALLNLVLNARDAMPEGGHLTIETANVVLDEAYAADHLDVAPGRYVMVSVTDTGSGMPPETVARAFEPFFTTKEVGKGSGLGLSMVYGFVKQSGGHAKIYSEVGEGTTLKIYFPRTTKARGAGDRIVDERPSIGGREHVLAVEDDQLVREYVTAQLQGLGYRVTAASDAGEALEILHQLPDVDLLLTDIVMPGGMNGRELAEAARAIRPSLRVLFTSGYTENAIVHHGRLDEGVLLLSKPYRRQELAAKVRRALDGR